MAYTDAAAAPAAPEDENTKQSQQAVNYRMGNPQRSCGLCANFGGSWGENAHSCRVVEGKISPYGYSDSYERQDNPFIAGTQSTFDEGSETESPQEDVAPEEEPERPRLQIGNRSY